VDREDPVNPWTRSGSPRARPSRAGSRGSFPVRWPRKIPPKMPEIGRTATRDTRWRSRNPGGFPVTGRSSLRRVSRGSLSPENRGALTGFPTGGRFRCDCGQCCEYLARLGISPPLTDSPTGVHSPGRGRMGPGESSSPSPTRTRLESSVPAGPPRGSGRCTAPTGSQAHERDP